MCFRRFRAKYGEKCEILTGVPREERAITDDVPDKIAWSHRMLSENVKVHTVARKDKIRLPEE